MSNAVNKLGGKCPYMPFLGRGQMSGEGTCKIFYMYNVTKLNLFADAPVRQNGNLVNVRGFLIMA